MSVIASFDKDMKQQGTGTFTSNSCSDGVIELSSDEFATCLPATISFNNNRNFQLQPTSVLAINTSYKVRLNGNLAQDVSDNSVSFQSNQGFRTTATATSSQPLTVTTTLNGSSIDTALINVDIAAMNNLVIRFSKPVNVASLTGNSSTGVCNGSIQFTQDNFSTCFDAVNTWFTTSDNTAFNLTNAPINLQYYRNYKVRITTAVTAQDSSTLTAQYQTAQGFSTIAPCGTLANPANCYV